jgi:hypothetical protein
MTARLQIDAAALDLVRSDRAGSSVQEDQHFDASVRAADRDVVELDVRVEFCPGRFSCVTPYIESSAIKPGCPRPIDRRGIRPRTDSGAPMLYKGLISTD